MKLFYEQIKMMMMMMMMMMMTPKYFTLLTYCNSLPHRDNGLYTTHYNEDQFSLLLISYC